MVWEKDVGLVKEYAEKWAEDRGIDPYLTDPEKLEERSLDELKEKCGKEATVFWVLSGLYFYIGSGRFFSPETLIFFLVGTFVAALIVGIAGYGLRRFVAISVTKLKTPPSKGLAFVLLSAGGLVTVFEAIACFKAAEYFFESQFFG